MMPGTQKNWAGNITYRAANWHTPQTIPELQELVARHDKIKAVGTRHSFNQIADNPTHLISLSQLEPTIEINAEQHTVTVSANVRYGELGQFLHRHGYALPNLASLPHISVVGACVTATHGSGQKIGNLATAVTAVQFIQANGEIITLSRAQHPDQFFGAVVNLGALGIMTHITLALQPTFNIHQTVYENLPLSDLLTHFDAIQASAYSVSLFTDWQGDTVNQVWLKQRDSETTPPDLVGAKKANGRRHPLANHDPQNCTEQLGIPGPWHERLPHFRLDFTPSSGAELQSEYFVARHDVPAALQAIHHIQDQIAPHLYISEIRTIAADKLWLSPCYQRPSVAIHFTWQPTWTAVRQVLPLIEAQLEPFNGRPHWGKLFTIQPTKLQSLYPQLPTFRQLCHQHDPNGKFHNPFLAKNIWAQL